MHGLLIIDKPAGPTSHDIVTWVRRSLGVVKAGHTGTLDPEATGVLPLVLGRATRLAQFLTGSDKTYEATIRFGQSTDTCDAAGRPVGEPWGGLGVEAGLARLAEADGLARALSHFAGTIEQIPPAYSAKHIDGVRAHELAREGKAVAPKAVAVTVRELTVLGREGDRLEVRVRASAGFYVRVLARDLGEALGVGAHLERLRRTASGEFTIDMAVRPETLEQNRADALTRLIPMERLLTSWPSAVVTAGGVTRIGRGMDVGPADVLDLPEPPAAPRVRLLAGDGRLLALAEPGRIAGFLHPFVVLG